MRALLLTLAVACTAPRHAPLPPTAEVDRVHQLDVPGDRPASVEVTAPSGRETTASTFLTVDGLAARVRPQEEGRYTWTARVDGHEVASGAFRAVDRGAPGQVVIRDGLLVREDGAAFHPTGENRFNVYDPTWSDQLDPEQYVARMAADGMNTLRVFVFTGCGGPDRKPEPGCLEPKLGRFDPVAAARYDAIFSAAERHDVAVVLSIFALGFTPDDVWKGFEDNPYSAERGGPAETPEAFFRDADARKAAKRRLRYVLARWGASPALLSVDLVNEPEWDGGIPEDAWIPWAEDLAATWHAEDPYDHPVTAGPVGPHWDIERDERPWWSSGACDIVQFHRYGPDVYEVHALADELEGVIGDLRRYGKPVLLGEFGYGGEPKPAYDHTHVGLWASTFAGAGVLAHSAPPFTIDSDEPMTPARAAHFRTLRTFLDEVAGRDALVPAPAPTTSVDGARARVLRAGERRVLWVLGQERGYGDVVRDLRVTIALPPGAWRVRWVDDVDGHDLAETVVEGGQATITAPPFVRHVAAEIVPSTVTTRR